MKTLLAGVSGTGKTAVGRRLFEQGYKVVHMDEAPGLCYWRNINNGEIVYGVEDFPEDFIEQHEWVCDPGRLQDILAERSSAIVVGMPDNLGEVINQFDQMLFLTCSAETFLDRIDKRTDNNFGKNPSAQKELIETYQEYNTTMRNLGGIEIDAEPCLDDVTAKVIEQLQK